MDVSEQPAEPARKRKRSIKKIGGEPTMASNLTPPPALAEERAQLSSAQNESTQPKVRRPRTRKMLEPQVVAIQPIANADQPAAQTLPDTPRANIEEAALATHQQAVLSANAGGNAQPAGVEGGVSPTDTTAKEKEKEAVSHGAHVLLLGVKVGGWLVNAGCTAIFSVLLGFSPQVTSVPLLEFIQSHKQPTLVILSAVLVLTLGMLVGWPSLHRHLQPVGARLRAMGAVTAVSTLSSLLCLSLLAITLLRPPWCPTALCATPRVVTKPITTTQGVHDANLDVYFVSFESAAFVIPGNPAQPTYIPSSGDLRSIGVVVPNASKTATPYTIAIGLHSLYTGRYSILIDKVALLVTGASRVPNPLRVYSSVVLTTYSSTNPSLFVYQGQQAGQMVADNYSTSPLPRVELRSGESDQIDATIEARTSGDVHFVIQVTYQIATEQQRFTLTLSHTFEAAFASYSTWQNYQLNLAQNNFVPVLGSGK